MKILTYDNENFDVSWLKFRSIMMEILTYDDENLDL